MCSQSYANRKEQILNNKKGKFLLEPLSILEQDFRKLQEIIPKLIYARRKEIKEQREKYENSE
jgi:hypothetical protein